MGLSKNITLTIKDYEIKLDKEIKFYENDTIDLCFSILEYGIEVKDGISINKLMPIQALRSYMLIETPHGIDYAESTKIEDNKIVFNLGTKYSQFVGIGRMQIVVKDSDGCRVTLPEFEFEIKESINMNWDRESFDFLATEDDSIIIDEFGRKIHMSKISDMPESENLSEESYAMIIDEEGNKRFKVRAIADAVEGSLDAKFNAYTDEINGDVEEFKGSVRTNITTLTNENNTFKNQVNTSLVNYGSDYNNFKDNVEARLGEHMTDYNRFKDGVEARIEEGESTYDGFVSNVSTVLDNYGSTYNAFKSEVNTANASFQSTLNASNQAFKNEMVDRYNNFIYKIDEDIFEGGRTDYFGETHEKIGERLDLDFDVVHQRINDSGLMEYEGCSIMANNTYYGRQKDTVIKGRTLQNLWNLEILLNAAKNGNEYTTAEGMTEWCRPLESTLVSMGETYTIIFEAKNTIDKVNIRLEYKYDGIALNIIEGSITPNQYTLFKVKVNLQYEGLVFNIRNTYGGVASVRNVMLLEGDHTQTPLEELPFIEGIESVGESELTDDGYKISGKSCGKNLFNGIIESGNVSNINGLEYASDVNNRTGFIRVEPNKVYVLSKNGNIQGSNIYYFSKDKKFLFHETKTTIYTPKECEYIRLTWGNTTVTSEDILQLNEGTEILPYEPYQESTYSYILNESLRSLPNGVCDTIDLETGVLTRRVGKVVLDGSQKQWWLETASAPMEGVLCFDNQLDFAGLGKIFGFSDEPGIICDKFLSYSRERLANNRSGIADYNGGFRIRVEAANLETGDVQGFIKWLSGNPVTVYCELAKPITEQLSPQRLKSFDTTTHIISENKLIPMVSTKIPTDLGAMVDTLSLRNRELEEVNEQQDELIDITMMATDEMYSMLEPLMEAVEPMGLLDCSKMAQMYVAMVQRGIKKIEDVPRRYQEEVREVLGIKIEEEEWGEDDGIK